MIPSAVIGVGSHHGDDNVGWLAVEMLQQKYASNTQLHFIKTECSVIDCWNLATEVNQWLFIDAIFSSAAPGHIHCMEVKSADNISNYQGLSSHGISLLDTIRMADSLNTLPERVLIWGIEMEHSRAGAQMSSAVSDAVANLVDSLSHFLEYDQLVLPEQVLLV